MYLSMPVVMALFESGPKIIHTACHRHVLDDVMDRNHVVVEATPVRFVEKGYIYIYMFSLTWVIKIRGLFTSRDASATSWS